MNTEPGRLTQEVAGNVRAVMGRERVSASRLGVLTGHSDFYIGRRIRGQVSMSLDDVEAFSRALGVPPSRLLGAFDSGTVRLPSRPVARIGTRNEAA